MEDTDLLRKARRVRVGDLPGAVRRAVVHQEDLQILHSLGQEGVHTRGEIIFHLVDRHNHAQLHIHSPLQLLV